MASLKRAPAPIGADVLDAPAHLVEHRLRARDVRRLAADEAEQLAFLGRADRPAHRALDESSLHLA